MDSFVEALLSEIEHKKDFFKNNGVPLTTIYIGGGTPSLLSPDQLSSITSAICTNFGISSLKDIREFTIEINPDDASREYFSHLKNLGVNRLSMGIQTFFDEQLKWMNRRHTAAQAVDAYNNARAVGFDNISLDLILYCQTRQL